MFTINTVFEVNNESIFFPSITHQGFGLIQGLCSGESRELNSHPSLSLFFP